MRGKSRREFLGLAAMLPCLNMAWSPVWAAEDEGALVKLKAGYAARLKRMLADGHLPYIDIESSCNSRKLDIAALAGQLDALHIGLMALSADPGRSQFEQGIRYDDLSERLLAAYPDRFIPVGNGGQPPFTTQDAEAFLAAQEAAAGTRPMLLLGEYEMRHYPSPRQVKRGELERDVDIPIDGPTGHRLFALGAKLGIPFQIHYEIEDRLLEPLERMLAQYPKAKVIWCHLAQIRYRERASRYSPDYVDGLIRRFPNLYFDTAFGDAASVYPLSNQRHARVWNAMGRLADDWKALIVDHPGRFLSALDLGGDRMERIVEYDGKHREFLGELPEPVRHQVAYGNAWQLLFGEVFG